jgi:hypothetical protein
VSIPILSTAQIAQVEISGLSSSGVVPAGEKEGHMHVVGTLPLPVEREVLYFKLAFYLVLIILVVPSFDGLEFKFQAARLEMTGNAVFHDFQSTILSNFVYCAVEISHTAHTFWKTTSSGAWRSALRISVYNSVCLTMYHSRWTGFTAPIALCAQVASGVMLNLSSRKRATFREAIEQHNVPAVAQVLLMPMFFGATVQLPAFFVFLTRFPNVLVAWWDYWQMNKGSPCASGEPSNVHTHRVGGGSKQEGARMFRQMRFCSVVWVIAMVFMFGIEADERISFHAAGSHFRYHHRVRCQLEAASPLYELDSRCGTQGSTNSRANASNATTIVPSKPTEPSTGLPYTGPSKQNPLLVSAVSCCVASLYIMYYKWG